MCTAVAPHAPHGPAEAGSRPPVDLAHAVSVASGLLPAVQQLLRYYSFFPQLFCRFLFELPPRWLLATPSALLPSFACRRVLLNIVLRFWVGLGGWLPAGHWLDSCSASGFGRLSKCLLALGQEFSLFFWRCNFVRKVRSRCRVR